MFILGVEVFSELISKAQASEALHGVQIAPCAPEISHLFFVDDSIVFFQANIQEAERMMQILTEYEQTSGPKINLDKSELSFS